MLGGRDCCNDLEEEFAAAAVAANMGSGLVLTVLVACAADLLVLFRSENKPSKCSSSSNRLSRFPSGTCDDVTWFAPPTREFVWFAAAVVDGSGLAARTVAPALLP